MKNSLLILATILFMAAFALVGTSLVSPKALLEALIISPRERDLGQLKPEVVSCEFDITNGLPYDVELITIQRSCGCTSVAVDKSLLKRRDSAHLIASIDLKGRAGRFASHLMIVYRQAYLKNARMQATACAAYANVDPIAHLTLDKMVFEEGQEATEELGISFTDSRYSVVKVTSSHKAFAPSLSKDSTKALVHFRPTLWGEHNGVPDLIIWTTCPFENRIKVPLVVQRTMVRPPVPSSRPVGTAAF